MSIRSTAAAVTAILHHASTFLHNNTFVSLISLDFSRVFDSVRHLSLGIKLSNICIPDSIYNWIITFPHNRSYVTRAVEYIAYINASVVKESGLGPSSYDVVESELSAASSKNVILKYADDTYMYLLVPASQRSPVTVELAHFAARPQSNNLKLNSNKSREMRLYRRFNFSPPPPIDGIVRVSTVSIFAVTLHAYRGFY